MASFMKPIAFLFILCVLSIILYWYDISGLPVLTSSVFNFGEELQIGIRKYEKLYTNLNASITELEDIIESVFFVRSFPVGLHIINESKILRMFQSRILGDDNSPIKFRFSGTSVTAGRDCYFNQSYPLKFKELFAPISSSLGLEIDVMNIAMGKNTIDPYNWCMDTLAGKADVLTWEQLLICTSGTPGCTRRFAQYYLENNGEDFPMILFIRGDISLGGKDYIKRTWSTVKAFEEFGLAALDASQSLKVMHRWERDDIDSWNNRMSLKKEGKAITKNNPFHPGPLAHFVTASILALEFSKYARVALEMLMRNEIVPKYYPYIASVRNSSSRPTCLTLAEPKSVRSNDLGNFIISEFQDIRPGFQEGTDFSSWIIELLQSTSGAVKKGEELGLGYIDRKWILKGNNESGILKVKITLKEKGKVRLGFYEKKYNPQGKFEIKANGELMTMNGWYIDQEFPPGELVLEITCKVSSSCIFSHILHA